MKNEYLERVRVGTEAVEKDLRSSSARVAMPESRAGSVATPALLASGPLRR